ncbi:hypothetical protein [uncultured Methanobrevibacter sp.]|uniref:hypothetical protein n=1 Tax=uncultured Methanobrevibacter sp. TaxID=253161 RepID=UPI0025DE3EED|nr:hypothetical protein [uncultured Methanobrevibacter sp.]
MINSLKQEAKELQEEIMAWEDYYSSEKKYFKIPNPSEIDGHYTKLDVRTVNVGLYKKKLEYLKIISEYYDNNDYIVDIDTIIRHGFDKEYLKKTQITPEIRDKLHRLIMNIEVRIMDIEKDMKNR